MSIDQAFLVFNTIIYSFILSPRIIKKYYKQSTHTDLYPNVAWTRHSMGHVFTWQAQDR